MPSIECEQQGAIRVVSLNIRQIIRTTGEQRGQTAYEAFADKFIAGDNYRAPGADGVEGVTVERDKCLRP